VAKNIFKTFIEFFTPALLGLFSIVTLLANLHAQKQKMPIQQTAWYIKKLPTFSDALNIVEETLRSHRYFRTSQFYHEIQKMYPLRSSDRFSRSTHASSYILFG
jgi:hypothetical protein